MIDTGSSDLWIDTVGANLTGAVDTAMQASIIYECVTRLMGVV